MKIQRRFKIIHFLLAAVLLTAFLAVIAPTKTLAASGKDQAKTYCETQYDSQGSKIIDACKYGYLKGYNKKSGGDCHAYVRKQLPDGTSNKDLEKSNLYSVCADGKTTGAKQRSIDDANNGGSGQSYKGSKCGNVDTFFNFACGSGTSNKSGGSDNPIFRILLTIVAWLTAGVMVAVIGGIVYGGFLYITAQDNASQTQKGITVIVDSMIGLIAFGLMWTILNFIIPGGIYAG